MSNEIPMRVFGESVKNTCVNNLLIAGVLSVMY